MTKSKRSKPTIDEQLRQVVLDSGFTVYGVAKESGVGQPVVSRLLSREHANIRLASAARIAAFLELELARR